MQIIRRLWKYIKVICLCVTVGFAINLAVMFIYLYTTGESSITIHVNAYNEQLLETILLPIAVTVSIFAIKDLISDYANY